MSTRSVNKVILVGNVGKDAETAYTASRTPVTKFSVATNRRWKDQASGEWKEETNWTNVVLWRNENLAPYLTKGKQVYIEGRIQTRSYEDRDGKKVYTTEVVAEEVILLGGDRESGSRPAERERPPVSQPRSASQASARPGRAADYITDDDVPF